ncbi:MAG: hypothetical protein L3J37_10060 [Rhodobacteraceae bacterium]|nr:hypothetical protein [Paracoccaceae bacterium]
MKLGKCVFCPVVIDDISRFTRDIEGHWALRRALEETGGTLESPSITFGEDSDSILIENLLASVSQHQRQKNAWRKPKACCTALSVKRCK